MGSLLILLDREWFVIIVSCQTHNNTKWRHLLKEVIVNCMQIQVLPTLINTEAQFRYSSCNATESNPTGFIFPCNYFDLKPFFFFFLLKKVRCIFEYFHWLERYVLPYASLVTSVCDWWICVTSTGLYSYHAMHFSWSAHPMVFFLSLRRPKWGGVVWSQPPEHSSPNQLLFLQLYVAVEFSKQVQCLCGVVFWWSALRSSGGSCA